MHKIAIGIYKDFTAACSVVRDLVENGFAREQIKLVACTFIEQALSPSHEQLPFSARNPLQGVWQRGKVGLVLFGLSGLLWKGIRGLDGVITTEPVALLFWIALGIGCLVTGMVGGFLVLAYTRRNPQGGSLILVKIDPECSPQALRIMKRYSPLRLEYGEEGIASLIAARPEVDFPSASPLEGLEMVEVSHSLAYVSVEHQNW